VSERAADSRTAAGEPTASLTEFLGEPTRDLAKWRWLWKGDHRFPIRSHRGFLGGLLVLFKRALRPLVTLPQNDLWERQRVFDLILLEHLQKLEELQLRARVETLEGAWREGLAEVLGHNDALFARVDQRLDRYRRETRDLWGRLGGALARAEAAGGAEPLVEARDEIGYLELERRHRGTEQEIAERITVYLPRLTGRGEILDLGCGRGEALALFAAQGLAARGVDSSAEMVASCRARGLQVERGDLVTALASQPEGSLGAVVSFHVIEHLPPAVIDRLVRLAWRALRPRGLLILETPNPLSLVVAARNFWLDPTHRRPVHPESLRLSYELAGFDPIERLDLRPFPASQRLPEIELGALPEAQRPLADQINRLRDRLDDLLFGCQDFALVGEKATAPPAHAAH
jgi:SAM-dependent methyltransferase